jgi:Ser/Thr protein kinase RdoA (MazF antagonist)
MSGTLVAVETAMALTTLAIRMAESAQKLHQIFIAAQSEGRDLTEEEVASIQEMRHMAVNRLEALK